MMFVPSGRQIAPVTHTDWEGVGVTPNVQAKAKNALDVAQIAILKQLIATETDRIGSSGCNIGSEILNDARFKHSWRACYRHHGIVMDVVD